jgi:hypothetical protein
VARMTSSPRRCVAVQPYALSAFPSACAVSCPGSRSGPERKHDRAIGCDETCRGPTIGCPDSSATNCRRQKSEFHVSRRRLRRHAVAMPGLECANSRWPRRSSGS